MFLRLIGMRKVAALAAAAVSLAVFVSGAGAAALQTGVKVRVAPAAGGPRTAFRLEFKTPPGFGSSDREAVVTVSGPGGGGCVSSEAVRLTEGLPGSADHLTLAPGEGRQWCAGTFRGTVQETIRPHCGPAQACPMFIAIARVGHFKFTVRR